MAAKSDPLAHLLGALRALLTWLKAGPTPGVVIGGVANAVLGRVRVTGDVDAVVFLPEEQWETFMTAGAKFGLFPRMADALEFAHANRVLLMYHEPSKINLDISLGLLPFEDELLERSTLVDLSGLTMPVPTHEDFIILKAIAHRPRDMVDIEGVLEKHPRLDLQRVRRWVRDFATVLEMPEIVDDLEKLLAHSRKVQKGRGKK